MVQNKWSPSHLSATRVNISVHLRRYSSGTLIRCTKSFLYWWIEGNFRRSWFGRKTISFWKNSYLENMLIALWLAFLSISIQIFLIIIFQDFHKVYLWQRNWEEMPTHVLGTNAGTIKISRLVNFYFFYVKSWSAWVTAAATVYIIWNTSTVFSLHTNKNRGPYSTNVFKGNIWGKLPALGLKFSLRLMVARRVGVDFYLLFNIAYAFQYFLCKRTHGKYSNPSKQWILLNFYLKKMLFFKLRRAVSSICSVADKFKTKTFHRLQ